MNEIGWGVSPLKVKPHSFKVKSEALSKNMRDRDLHVICIVEGQ